MCSDTKYSGTTIRKKDGPKLWVLRRQDPVVVFGGASENVGALYRAKGDIERRLKPSMSIEDVVDEMDAVLKRTHERYPGLGLTPVVQAMAVVRVGNEARLFFNGGGDTSLSPAHNDYVCLGVEDLGNYLAEKLFRGGMSIKWTSVIAAHLVAQCKDYATGSCGGDTHIIEIPHEGPPHEVDDHAVKALERYLDGIDAAYEAILPGGSPMESDPDESLSERARAIRDAIKEAAETTYHRIPGEPRPFGIRITSKLEDE